MARHRTTVLDRAFSIAWPLAVAAFAAVLCLEAAALVAVAPEVVVEASGSTDTLFVIVPFPTKVVDVGGEAPVVLFVFFMAAILVSLFWLLKDWESVTAGFHRALKDRVEVPSTSQAGLSMQLFCVMLLGSVAWYLVLAMVGVETTTPSFDEMDRWVLGYEFAKASVYEELVTRVFYIGVPMAIIALSKKRPGWWKLFLGNKGNLETADWVLIAASGAVFGLAHAPGWDFWKVPPTIISGLAFGYLFAKKGLAPAIVVHFAIDYLSMPYLVFGLETMDLLLTIFLLAAVVLGVYFAARFALEASESASQPGPVPPLPPPQVWMAQAPRFVCMKCGEFEASYSKDSLRCLKCNQEYRYL